ncbi:hypothetical protein U1Q18_017968 [Sarracenia purpurea var. burkii]
MRKHGFFSVDRPAYPLARLPEAVRVWTYDLYDLTGPDVVSCLRPNRTELTIRSSVRGGLLNRATWALNPDRTLPGATESSMSESRLDRGATLPAVRI